jgi:hypothetical protein
MLVHNPGQLNKCVISCILGSVPLQFSWWAKSSKEQTNFGKNIKLEKTNCNIYLFGFLIPEDCTLVLWEVFSYSLKLFEPHIPKVANESFTH